MVTSRTVESAQVPFLISAAISKLCRTYGQQNVERVMQMWLSLWDEDSENGSAG